MGTLLGICYGEITLSKLQFTKDSFNEYISNLYNLSLDNAETFWEVMFTLWNPEIFLPYFGHRIPNKEEKRKVKAKVTAIYVDVQSSYNTYVYDKQIPHKNFFDSDDEDSEDEKEYYQSAGKEIIYYFRIDVICRYVKISQR